MGGEVRLSADPAAMKGGLPKIGTKVVLTSPAGHVAWMASAGIVGQEGSRLEPVLVMRLEGAWSLMIRRATNRVAVDSRLELVLPDPRRSGELNILRGRFIDISLTGCRVRVVGDVEPGTMVTVRFAVPEAEKEASIMAQVVRCRDVGGEGSQRDLGIRFARLDDSTREMLNDWLSAKMELEKAS